MKTPTKAPATISTTPIDFGYASRTVRTSFTDHRIHIRSGVVAFLFIGSAALLALIAIGIGQYPLNPLEVFNAIIASISRLLPTLVEALRTTLLPVRS